jgi:hypothetical protein
LDDILNEDFEDGDFVGWTEFADSLTSSTPTIVATAAAATTQGLNLESSASLGFGSGYTGIQLTIPATSPTFAGFWIRKPATDTNARFRLLNGSAIVITVGLSENGTIMRGTTSSGTYAANTWYHFEIRNINLAGGTYNLYVNNALVGAGTFVPPASGTVNRVQLSNEVESGFGSTAESIWDEILIQ